MTNPDRDVWDRHLQRVLAVALEDDNPENRRVLSILENFAPSLWWDGDAAAHFLRTINNRKPLHVVTPVDIAELATAERAVRLMRNTKP